MSHSRGIRTFAYSSVLAAAGCLAFAGCADNHNTEGSPDEWSVGERERGAEAVGGGLGPFAERVDDGRYCRIDYIERDIDDDGEIEQLRDAVYSEGGAVRVFEVDGGVDGDIENLELTERDAQGRVIREQSAGGAASSGYRDIRLYEYNERGLLARETYDEDLDGELEDHFTFEYDEQRRRTVTNYVDLEIRITYEYNEDGTEKVSLNWREGTLIARNVRQWEFDDSGRKVRQDTYLRTEEEDDGLGERDEWFTWRYEDGHLVEERWSADGGDLTSTSRMSYQNGLMQTLVFEHESGRRQTDWYTWECTGSDT